MSTSSSVGLQIAATAATTGSLFLGGLIASISTITVPVLMAVSKGDSSLAEGWQATFNRGSVQGPSIGVITFVTHLSVAYSKYAAGYDWKFAAAAAALTIGIVPFTRLIMFPTNGKLAAAAQQRKVDESVSTLLSRWQILNLVRAMFPVAGGVVGILGLVRSS